MENKIMKLTFASVLSDLKQANSSFDSGVLQIAYTGVNRNNTSISKEAFEKALPSIYNCPVVCNYDRDSDTLGGHDMEIVSNDEGDIRLVNLTTPVGVIPESAKYEWKTVTEEDGTEHEYLCVETLLWKRQEAYSYIKEHGVVAQSMEITVLDGEKKDDVYEINDFEFTAFALIGVEPCFESASLVFSLGEIKEEFALMMADLKEAVSEEKESLNSSEEEFENTTIQAEGGETILGNDIDNEVEVAEEQLAEATSEETEVFEANTEDAENAEKSEIEGSFALVNNIMQELRCAVASEIVTDEDDWSHPKYYLIDADLDKYVAIVCEWDTGRLYGVPMNISGDAIGLDFENAKRYKQIFVEFEEGDDSSSTGGFWNEYAVSYAEAVKKAEAEMNAALAEKEQMSKDFAEAEKTIGELEKFKADVEAERAMAAQDEIFSRFPDLEGNEAFELLRSDRLDCDLETLEEKCFAIRGKAAQVKFSREDSTTKLKVSGMDEDDGNFDDRPYGDLFDKYDKD